MKINMSLYGLVQSTLYWFNTLKKALDYNGFKQSDYDHSLFYGKKMIFLCYFNDVIFFGPDQAKIYNLISKLEKDGFNLTKEMIYFIT